MTYGPMEFAAYLKRKDAGRGESAAVKAAREAAPMTAPGARPEDNRLTIISGGPMRSGHRASGAGGGGVRLRGCRHARAVHAAIRGAGHAC